MYTSYAAVLFDAFPIPYFFYRLFLQKKKEKKNGCRFGGRGPAIAASAEPNGDGHAGGGETTETVVARDFVRFSLDLVGILGEERAEENPFIPFFAFAMHRLRARD